MCTSVIVSDDVLKNLTVNHTYTNICIDASNNYNIH